jgi:hypothetical protein
MKKKLPPWPGDCFQRAGLEMMLSSENPEMRLVHAEVPSTYEPGRWVTHAWCEMPATFGMKDDETGREWEEPGVVVVDMTQPDPKARIVPREIYYEKCSPRNLKRYTLNEMIERALRHGHDGPWPD